MRQYILVEVEVGPVDSKEAPSVSDWGSYKHLVKSIRRGHLPGVTIHGVLELTQNGIERMLSQP